jgi:hypothetical protein
VAVRPAPRPVPIARKAGLVLQIWWSFVRVHWGLVRQPLPELVRDLARPAASAPATPNPARLARAVDRALRVRGRRPRCLINALVLFRLLRRAGADAVLVIGLLPEAPDHEAHAWVELDGRDVGPPPGRGRHVAMARYP